MLLQVLLIFLAHALAVGLVLAALFPAPLIALAAHLHLLPAAPRSVLESRRRGLA